MYSEVKEMEILSKLFQISVTINGLLMWYQDASSRAIPTFGGGLSSGDDFRKTSRAYGLENDYASIFEVGPYPYAWGRTGALVFVSGVLSSSTGG